MASCGLDAATPKHKRARGGPLSCAECRRLKLKCSRTFPCLNCMKKGCSAICPEGRLTTGRGNRFVLANTEVLHEKINQLANRVRDLEDALSEAHAMNSSYTHHLLTEDLLQIKRPLEREWPESSSEEKKPELGDDIEAIGLLSISNDGRSAFFGKTASAWLLLQNKEGFEEGEARSPATPFPYLEVSQLGASFPFSLAANIHTTDIREDIFQRLPPLQIAQNTCHIYFSHAAWMYTPIPENDFYETVFRPIYHNVTQQQESANSHLLAILLMALAIGSLLDLEKSPESLEANRFYDLARAALSLDPVMEEHSIPGIQALLMMCHFLFLLDQSGARWVIMGMLVKLAQSVGLHRDSIRWGLDPGEAQKRRMLFYELVTYDSWQSLTFGRPPSISSLHFDTRLPFPTPTGQVEMSFAAWKHKFTSQCLNIVHDEAFGARMPNYKTLKELDKRVRQFEVPPNLQVPGFGSVKGSVDFETPSVELTMQRYTASSIKEMTLFYMHRGYFAQAMEDNPVDPMATKFSQSVLAAYNSACAYIGLIESLFNQHPALTERMWFLFTHVFSCAIVLGAVAAKTRMQLAPSALSSLEAAHNLFCTVTARTRTVKILAILEKLMDKARSAQSSTALPATMNGQASFGERSPESKELSSLNGMTQLVSRRSPPSSLYTPSPPAQSESPNAPGGPQYDDITTSVCMGQWQVPTQTTSQFPSCRIPLDITSYGEPNLPSGPSNDYFGYQTSCFSTLPTSESMLQHNPHYLPSDSWNNFMAPFQHSR